MTIAMLATGEELIHGDTLDTNSHFFANILSTESLKPGMRLICGDKISEIIDALEFLARGHQTIIIIGGLGPTTDDLTRFALAKFLNKKLVKYPQALEHLKKFKTDINDSNLQQILFPKDCSLIANPNGTALGCYLTHNNRDIFLLPGPPSESRPMFENFVIKKLRKNDSHKIILKWLLFGIPESNLNQLITKAFANIAAKIGFRLDKPYIELKICLEPHLKEEVTKLVTTILKDNICKIKASQKLKNQLPSLPAKLAIFDNATGGDLQKLLIDCASYKFLSFNKTEEILVNISGLEQYWQGEKTGRCNLVVTLTYKELKFSEKVNIKNTGVFLLYYISEWLCFWIIDTLDKLHDIKV